MTRTPMTVYVLMAGITPVLVLLSSFLATTSPTVSPWPAFCCEESSNQTDGALGVLADD